MNKLLLASFEIEVVNREYKFVGMYITGNFPESFPEVAVTVQREFWERRKEIKNSKDYETLFSPGMCNGILATYFACIEVTEVDNVPEGMIAFTLPDTEYVKVSCTNKTIGEGYNKLFDWMKQNRYEHKFYGACQIEIFYINDEVDEEPVEILIPISKLND
ncbi:GyrI-like domain-containing protein [Paenibacillus septentrionalis]|uniref:GyrI-like domain-containing protein n=1 Tax=Paenibacillus septentrionalis TaxID=429342 RepID=A0ABW1V5B5_9BACL